MLTHLKIKTTLYKNVVRIKVGLGYSIPYSRIQIQESVPIIPVYKPKDKILKMLDLKTCWIPYLLDYQEQNQTFNGKK